MLLESYLKADASPALSSLSSIIPSILRLPSTTGKVYQTSSRFQRASFKPVCARGHTFVATSHPYLHFIAQNYYFAYGLCQNFRKNGPKSTFPPSLLQKFLKTIKTRKRCDRSTHRGSRFPKLSQHAIQYVESHVNSNIFFHNLFKPQLNSDSNDTIQNSVTQPIAASNKRDHPENSEKFKKKIARNRFEEHGSNAPLFATSMDPEISSGETSAQISFQIQDTSIFTSPREIHAQISPKTSSASALPPKKRTPEHNSASVSPPVQKNNSVPQFPQDDVIEIDDPDTIYLPLFNKSAVDQTNYLPDIIDLFIESGLVFDLTGTKKNTQVIQYRLAWYTNDEAMTARSDIVIPESAPFSWNPP